MSLSKEKLTIPGAAAELPRQPKCTRCRHHGIVVPQKGHMKLCPFLKCACWRCLLITERTRITALQRNLRRAEENKPQTKAKRPRDSEARPAAPGASSRPLANGDPGSVVTSGRSPLDLRCGPAVSDRTTVLTCPPTETPGNFTPLSAAYFGELRPSAPLPFVHFPFRMSGPYPSSYAPCPDFTINMPWLAPLPAELYNHGLHAPLLFPHFQQRAVHFPPPPEPAPPADCKQVFITLQPSPLPEAFQEELMSRHPQPPLAKQADPDVVELD